MMSITLPWIRRRPEYPNSDEPEITIIREHPAVLIRPAMLVVTGFILAYVLYATTKTSGIVVILIWSALGLLVLNLIIKVMLWFGCYCVATSKWMLFIFGVHIKCALLRSDQVTPWTPRPSAIGRLLGYGDFEFGRLNENDPLKVVKYVPSHAFEQILRAMSSDTQQTGVKSGNGHMTMDTRKHTFESIWSNPSHRLELLICIAAVVAMLVLNEEPGIQQVVNTDVGIMGVAVPIIALVLTLSKGGMP